MDELVDGFYAVYLTGKSGNGLTMLVINHGLICGADMLGMTYDGSIKPGAAGDHEVSIDVKIPSNLPLVQGGLSGIYGEDYKLNFSLGKNFLAEDFYQDKYKKWPRECKIY